MFDEKDYQRQYRLAHKDTNKEYKHKYYLENKERVAREQKEYYQKNADRIKARIKQYAQSSEIAKAGKIRYREEHQDEIKQYRKNYRITHTDKIKEHDVKYRELCMVNLYRRNDEQKGLVCDLTPEWMKEHITSKSCIYCGDIRQIGCDRIDHEKGHTMDNVIPSCRSCNVKRHRRISIEAMIERNCKIRKIRERKLVTKTQELNNDQGI